MNVEDCYLSISVEHWPSIGVRTTRPRDAKRYSRKWQAGPTKLQFIQGIDHDIRIGQA